jgi:hypothetical protein
VERDVAVLLVGRRRPRGPSSPGLGRGSGNVSHGDVEAAEDRSKEGRLRRTPTWHAKCRISGSARPLRFELWGACEELVLSDLPTRCLDELER